MKATRIRICGKTSAHRAALRDGSDKRARALSGNFHLRIRNDRSVDRIRNDRSVVLLLVRGDIVVLVDRLVASAAEEDRRHAYHRHTGDREVDALHRPWKEEGAPEADSCAGEQAFAALAASAAD